MSTVNINSANGNYRKRNKITGVAGQSLGFNAAGDPASILPKNFGTNYTANGALTVSQGLHLVSKTGSIAAMTIAAPTTAQNGTQMIITSGTALAHTVTFATVGFNAAGAAADVATFGGAIGDTMVINAYGGNWYVQNLRNVTLG